jgi:hypothetical protein
MTREMVGEGVMSQDNYVGLHGRNPYEQGHTWADADGSVHHYAPEGWEDLDAAICPGCGRTVSWSDRDERWVIDPTTTVLVLSAWDFSMLRGVLTDRAPSFLETGTWQRIRIQNELNRPVLDDDV